MLNLMSIRYPADLPITARRQEIVAAIRGHQVLDLATETCSEGSQRDRHFILLYFIGRHFISSANLTEGSMKLPSADGRSLA